MGPFRRCTSSSLNACPCVCETAHPGTCIYAAQVLALVPADYGMSDVLSYVWLYVPATIVSRSIFVSVGVQALVSTLLILAASYAFHFDVMWQNSFWLSFLLLLMTNLALVAFCFFIRWIRALQ